MASLQTTHASNGEHSTAREYLFEGYRVDLAKYELWRGDQLLPLTAKVFDTLAVLISNRDHAVSKDELLRLVWPDYVVSEDSLTQSISMLRRALGDDPTHPKFIATIARRGYRFVAPVEEVSQEGPLTEMVAAPAPEPSALETQYVPEGLSAPGSSVQTAGLLRRKASPILMIVAFAAIVLAVIWARPFSAGQPKRDALGPLRFAVTAPTGLNLASGGALSPNGRYLAFLGQDADSGGTQIWVRPLDSLQPRALAGTEGASQPFWSPDNRYLGFFANGKLKRASIGNDEPSRVIASTGPNSSGASWSSKDVIIFADQRSGLFSVPALGGTPQPLTTLSAADQEVAHRSPQFLPDGQHYLYLRVSARADRTGTYLGSLHSDKTVRVIDVPAIYAAPGYLVYVRDHLLMAVHFDVSKPESHSIPAVIEGAIMSTTFANDASGINAGVSASDNGLLSLALPVGTPRLKVYNRMGTEVGTFDMPVPVHNPILSPDQKQALVGSREGDHGIWLVDLDRGVSTRFSNDGMRPLFAADGSQVLYSSDRIAGVSDLYIKRLNGPNEEKLLLRSGENKIANDWSADGRYVVFQSASSNPDKKLVLWLLPLFGDSKPRPLLNSPFNEAQGQISPDGHWIAYTSDESGSWEVYLQSFPEPGAKRVLSVGGGAEPHWRGDGRELFYLSLDRKLMAVTVSPGNPPDLSRPHAIFKAPVLSVRNVLRNQYAVASDGQRFIFGSVEKNPKDDSITVLAGWTGMIRQ